MRYVALAVLLGGCAGMPQEHATTANVPLTVPCREKVERPAFADTGEALRSAPGVDIRVNRLLAGRIQRDKYIDDLEASVEGCVFAD